MREGEEVIVSYNEGGHVRKMRGRLKDSNIHIVVVNEPEELSGDQWKSLELEKIELTRCHVVSIGYPKPKSGVE